MTTCCEVHYGGALLEISRRLAVSGVHPGDAMVQVKEANPVLFAKAIDGLTAISAQGTPCAGKWERTKKE